MSIESTIVTFEIKVVVYGTRLREKLDTTPVSYEEIVDRRRVDRYEFEGKSFPNGARGCDELIIAIEEAATNQAEF